MTPRRFRGIYPILYAFFGPDDRLDHVAMRRQVQHCLDAGAHGIAVLGLVTEVHKMSERERRELVACVGETLAGRVPYAVTVAEPSVDGQVAFAKAARADGADWVILQPPPVKGVAEAELIRFFGAVAERLDMAVAVQNNPVNLDVSLSSDGLVALARAHANLTLFKGEGPAVEVRRVIEALDGGVDVFSGRGGLELVTSLLSGAAGCVPAPDCVEAHVRIFELMETGREADRAAAVELHRRILPLTVFMSHSVEHMLAYGKRHAARLMGLGARAPRAPSVAPTPFGLAELDRLAAGAAGAAAAEAAE